MLNKFGEVKQLMGAEIRRRVGRKVGRTPGWADRMIRIGRRRRRRR